MKNKIDCYPDFMESDFNHNKISIPLCSFCFVTEKKFTRNLAKNLFNKI